jgi:hypothetical protein
VPSQRSNCTVTCLCLGPALTSSWSSWIPGESGHCHHCCSTVWRQRGWESAPKSSGYWARLEQGISPTKNVG